ncbi:hypothetical protein HYPSUDRAFT_56817 [Hypholoma sublateritium FD-334 SS-4]|uniref:Major facilitator superfamily (MFS) profile domain-containing protein n=1 Tax=Hypholoma sublateritium (strain FD-334 SS-4) TaxID=945553 RepID=A0A0D2NJS6_HYPSF|nr:hypothetical protein HYPSUDRAFT_56817 [Hypholoma sublateritium FD-334 SS-4]
MSMTCSERDPLLRQNSASVLSSILQRNTPRYGLDIRSPTVSLSQPLGPLEISSSARNRILAGIWIAQFLSGFTNDNALWILVTLVPTMLPSISSEYNKSNEASWVGTSYLLATCTFTPLYGRLSDVMGRGGASQSAIIFAAIGILACGVSNSMQMLIVARFISGMGGGGIFTTAAIITSDMYNGRSRGFIQSLGGIFYGLGMGLGGSVGGVITDWLGWRWAFIVQIPLFALAFLLISCHLTYVTPGSGRSAKDVLSRIDYGGSLALLGTVGSMLFFLSTRFNEGLPWSNPYVWISFVSSISFALLFLIVESFVAVEPILPPYLLMERVPILIGLSNALVAVCNLSVTYYYPTWFQTVMLSSASTAGLHLLPNSFCISTGSLFAGWMMRRYGRYKLMNMIFGILPFFAAVCMTQMREDSSQAHLWLTIMPLGFGNAVVMQTMFIALVSHLPESQLAVGTGFAQLLRGLGQVAGLATASAVFQSRLDTELHARFPSEAEEASLLLSSTRSPNSHTHRHPYSQIIKKIQHSAKYVAVLPPATQRIARDSFASSLKSVFIVAAGASLLAYLARIPIPDKRLEDTKGPLECESRGTSSASETSSVFEEIRDDEDKVVRPRHRPSAA